MILLLLFTYGFSNWTPPTTCPSSSILAEEMSRYKLSGINILSNSSCLQQSIFPHIKIDVTISGEKTNDLLVMVDSYTVEAVKEIESDLGKEVAVTVSLKVNGRNRSDSFSFIRMDDSPNKKDFGCAIEGSKDFNQLYVLKACKN